MTQAQKSPLAAINDSSPLVENLPWFERIIPRGERLPISDFSVPMMSLGRLLGVNYHHIPTPIPYISVPIAQSEKWAQRLQAYAELLVGMTWFGNPDNPVNQLRSIPLKHFQSLAELENIRLVSLQTGPAVADLRAEPMMSDCIGLNIIEQQQSLDFSFLDTAALLLNLDIFITSCTVSAHLAGALGVRTYLAVSNVADWRWGVDEAYSRWYPSIRIFRQPKHGDWASVFQQIRQSIQLEVLKRKSN